MAMIRAPVKSLIDHIDHIAKLPERSCGLGSDSMALVARRPKHRLPPLIFPRLRRLWLIALHLGRHPQGSWWKSVARVSGSGAGEPRHEGCVINCDEVISGD